MAQPLRHADHIRPAGDRYGGGAVPELVGVEILDTVPLSELLKIPGGALGVHRLRCSLLGKAPL